MILTVTLNPAIDLNLEVPSLAALGRGDLARTQAVRRAAGGKGVNVSRVLAELRVPSTCACAVGGPDGDVLLSLLKGARFRVAPLRIAGATRTNVVISSPAYRKQFKINQPGPAWSRGEWPRVRRELAALFEGCHWVALSGALPPGVPAAAYAELVRAAHRAGARVALDCEGEPLRLALAQRPDLIKPNRAELAATLGRPVASRAAALEGALALRAAGAGIVVISAGAGEVLAVAEEAWRARPPKVRGGSPMGAGDSLVAGLLAGLARGKALPEALRLGVACGAATAASPDTVLAPRKMIQSFLTQTQSVSIGVLL